MTRRGIKRISIGFEEMDWGEIKGILGFWRAFIGVVGRVGHKVVAGVWFIVGVSVNLRSRSGLDFRSSLSHPQVAPNYQIPIPPSQFQI